MPTVRDFKAAYDNPINQQLINPQGLSFEQWLQTPTQFYGGNAPSQMLGYASQGQITNALDPSQQNFGYQEATGSLMPSSTDMGGFALGMVPLALMAGGAAGVGGLSNAGWGEAAGGLGAETGAGYDFGMTGMEGSSGGGLFGGSGYSGEGLTSLASDSGGAAGDEIIWNGATDAPPLTLTDTGGAGDSWISGLSNNSVLGAGASLLSGGLGLAGSLLSSNAQQQSARDAQNTIWNMYQQNRTDLEPWRKAGIGALGNLTNLTTPGKQFDAMMLDPGYQFRLGEGNKAIDAAARARGLFDSGRTMKALTDYGQNFATGEFSNVFNRNASLAGLGQTATNTGVNAGQNAANNVAGIMQGAGNARASGYMGGANALAGGIGSGLNLYNQLSLLESLRGG